MTIKSISTKQATPKLKECRELGEEFGKAIINFTTDKYPNANSIRALEGLFCNYRSDQSGYAYDGGSSHDESFGDAMLHEFIEGASGVLSPTTEPKATKAERKTLELLRHIRSKRERDAFTLLMQAISIGPLTR